MKTLKIWNGRCYSRPVKKDKLWEDCKFNQTPHLYICAYSMADAARICAQYFNDPPSYGEMKNYWSPNCWGRRMDGIQPERGLWIQFRNDKPVKVV